MNTLKKIQLYQQDRLSAIGICILILFMISSCGKKTESNEITEESTHTHSDDIEKVTNLQITSRQYKTADIELGNVQETGLTQLQEAPLAIAYISMPNCSAVLRLQSVRERFWQF